MEFLSNLALLIVRSTTMLVEVAEVLGVDRFDVRRRESEFIRSCEAERGDVDRDALRVACRIEAAKRRHPAFAA